MRGIESVLKQMYCNGYCIKMYAHVGIVVRKCGQEALYGSIGKRSCQFCETV